MSAIKYVVEEGVVLMYEDKFWGVIYKDGNACIYGWTDIKNATLASHHCQEPRDMTYESSPYLSEMNKGRIVKIKRTTNLEVLNERVKQTQR